MNVIPRAVQLGFLRLIGPLVQLFVRLHIRPNTITTIGTLVVLVSAAAFARGHVHWAGFLLLLSGVFDMLDGQVARDGGPGPRSAPSTIRRSTGWATAPPSSGSAPFS
jgi:hypothetical protein